MATKKKRPKKPRPPVYDSTIVAVNRIAVGYDPGVRGGAFSVIDNLDDEVYSFPIVNKKGTTEFEAARFAAGFLSSIFNSYQPSVIVIERPFLKFSARTQFQLDFIVGYVACAAEELGLTTRVVPISVARADTGDSKPESKGIEKDLYDARTFARYGRLLITPITSPIGAK